MIKIINVPPMLIDDMGIVIGKKGKNFINITNLSGLERIWHDKSNNTITMTADDDSGEKCYEQWRIAEILLANQFNHVRSIMNKRRNTLSGAIDEYVDETFLPSN